MKYHSNEHADSRSFNPIKGHLVYEREKKQQAIFFLNPEPNKRAEPWVH